MDINRPTKEFIERHLNDDVRTLALKKCPQDVDLPFALAQISGHQYAISKIPEWASAKGIIYPKHLSLEQCTNELIARYKKKYISNILGKEHWSMADFTGGMGIDCYYLSSKEESTLYNEMDNILCETARHNFNLLGRSDIEISNLTAEEYIDNNCHQHFDLVYLDPARRSATGKKLVSISECMPDVTKLQHKLTSMADIVAIKLSPMLDISTAIREIEHISHILIISLDGECKEMLLLINALFNGNSLIESININSNGNYSELLSATLQDENITDVQYADINDICADNYLYEPFAAQMKSGLYKTIAIKYSCKPVSPISHLYISDFACNIFPGRHFIIKESHPFNKRTAKELFSKYPQANIAVRNFPIGADELRKKFKVRDGGNIYIFGTTCSDIHILIVCTKAY